MRKFLGLKVVLAVAAVCVVAPFAARAGFGVTPPYVTNEALTKGSYYEQNIILVRSDPVEDLKAEVTVDVPGANEWITTDRGFEFLIPKGEKKTPLKIQVQVPDKVEFRQYTGNIRVRVLPQGSVERGTVTIALGVQLDVDLNVIDRKIFDFKVWGVRLSDLEEGHKFLWLYFPGKIRFGMKIESIGNIPASPTSVQLKLYDTRGNLLETVANANKIKRVDPFHTEEVTAEFPTHLKAGAYKAVYTIYKNDEVSQEGELHLSILPYGAIPGYKGYGIWGLSTAHKLSIVLIIAVTGGGFAYGVYTLRKKVKRTAKKPAKDEKKEQKPAA